MARRRFVWSKEHDCLVEVTADYVQPSRQSTDHVLWGDRGYANLQTTDGVDISTRTKHREYMKANGLTTYDDYAGHFDREAQRRAEYYTTGKGGATRKEDVARAIAELERKNK